MIAPSFAHDWKRCGAATRKDTQCVRNARVHAVTDFGVCLAHYCTQHSRSWMVPATGIAGFDHVEVYST